MPKKLTDQEKEFIRKRLKEEALKSLSVYGVKRTTVDDLVKKVNIPKGTFYLFYESKELLLFDALNDLHEEIQKKLLQDLAEIAKGITVEKLTGFLVRLYKEVSNSGLLTIMVNGELEFLMRRLPEDIVKDHLLQDDLSVEKFVSFLPHKDEININAFSAAFRGVFLTMLYKREIGEEIFDEAMKLMLRGLVIQMMEDNNHD